MGYPSGPGMGPPPRPGTGYPPGSGPGIGYPPYLDLRWGTPLPRPEMGYPPESWTDTHLWKHNLPSYVRTRAVNIPFQRSNSGATNVYKVTQKSCLDWKVCSSSTMKMAKIWQRFLSNWHQWKLNLKARVWSCKLSCKLLFTTLQHHFAITKRLVQIKFHHL